MYPQIYGKENPYNAWSSKRKYDQQLYKYQKQDRHCTYNVTLRHVRVKIAGVESSGVLHILSVSVTLVIQHEQRMSHVLSYILSLVIPYFSALSYKRHDYRKTFIGHTILFWFSLRFFLIISHSRKNLTRYYDY